ncbi:hypothetical protein SARC_01460 [Sphaeroforma arctica JP610]|uniref:Homeobox domain-containing protein n=1 Tax=Sphaeroforma arctica JP610 TaxID=667725 RepID=A0A0L0GBN2_9EUKA|nr:hypothetical protein SARC_01460 [Sphaeroforma arctica JP610]KNC86410.1 hypothetical protein SARC_01460 [Sphaeroforma arctica JP610]|eukprot:XP_014160312.1 hypothetical protein SARC_01460 [Sphaeroforma arctica JP610]
MTLPMCAGYDVDSSARTLAKRLEDMQSLESPTEDQQTIGNGATLKGSATDLTVLNFKHTLPQLHENNDGWSHVTRCQACVSANTELEPKIKSLSATQYEHFFSEQARQYDELHRQIHQLLELLADGPERNARDSEAKQMLDRIHNLINDSIDEALQKHGTGASTGAKRRRQLPPAAHSILKKWLYENQDCPYPSDEQKQQLAEECQLEIQQIRNWFANTRNRKRHLFAQTKT